MKNISLLMIALLLCLGAAKCQCAYADNLSECFLDMGQADYSVLQFEAPFMAPMALSTQIEHRTFHGFFYPNTPTSTLAIRSDDGSTVTITTGYTQPLLAKMNKGQQWEDIPHSLNALPTYTPHPGMADEITINYSNIVYNGDGDLDGLSLYGLNGSGSVTDVPIAVTTIQDQTGSGNFANAPLPPAVLTIAKGSTIAFQALNNSTDPSKWPTGIVPIWSISPIIGVSMTMVTSPTTASSSSSSCNVYFSTIGSYTLSVGYNTSQTNPPVSTIINVIDPTSIVVSYTSLPAICAGGTALNDESVHSGIVTVNATSGGIGISNVTIGLDFAAAVQQSCTGYPQATIPTFANTSIITDNYGNASTIITSGTAVFPAQYHCPLPQAILTIGGTIQPNANTSFQTIAPAISLNAYYSGKFDPVTDFDLFGDCLDLWANITYTDSSKKSTNIISHKLEWNFKYFDHDPSANGANPMNDPKYKFDGSISESDPDNPGYTLYGQIIDVTNPQGPADSYYACYVSGTTPGWVYWYVNDKSVMLDTP